MRTTLEEFHLLPEHIKLLTSGRVYVDWQDCETGAPEINPKRPYGNSDVHNDVIEILGWPEITEEDEDTDAYETKMERAMQIHRGTAKALEIMLSTKSIKPGVYRRKETYGPAWERVADLP